MECRGLLHDYLLRSAHVTIQLKYDVSEEVDAE